MDTKKVAYFSDFLACPLAALAVAYVTLRGSDAFSVSTFLASITAGLCAWTLVEYVVHRLVYHSVPLIRDLHALHHRAPRSYEGTPPFLSVLLIWLCVYAPLHVLGNSVAGGATIGMLIGYVVYMSIHHSVHHVRPRHGTFFYALWKLHARHHHAQTEGNYGVTSNVWDRVFHTRID